jgi:3-hexulose-6-phosphate synthase/6-phospho-3-hexuloisomerase
MTETDLEHLLREVGTANLSNAMDNRASLRGIGSLVPGTRAVGPAVTVRTTPGDWSATVRAIDIAEPGQVIVVEAGGEAPAVWGELATESCLVRGIAGLVVDGAVRDVADIRRLGFPVWAKLVCSDAGVPKGGEINQAITISGQTITPGDWIVADDDGVMVLPLDRAAELAEAAAVLVDREGRLREKIRAGSTLGKVLGLDTES